MGYASREKKRKAHLAEGIAKSKNRKSYPERWYLTIVKRNGCCNKCGGYLKEGRECVFRYTPREILCRNCASLESIAPRPSVLWEKTQAKERARRKRGPKYTATKAAA